MSAPGRLRVGLALGALPLAKLVLHLATSAGYGIFRDELYYLANAQRLGWGYVDHPPLSILALAGQTALLGDSLPALRFLPALAGALTVLLIGLLARRLGGGWLAVVLAQLAALATPLWLALSHYYSMNALDLLAWAGAAVLFAGLLRDDAEGRPPAPWQWALLGVVLGLGLQNKISVLWLGFGFAAGLLLTPARRLLATRGPYLAGGVALAIFLPYVIWNAVHDWPTLEFVRNATAGKMARIAPHEFLLQQLLEMGPHTALVWLAGLLALLATRGGPLAAARPLGWAWIAIAGLLAVSGTARASYLAPGYAWLFAAGGVAWERLAGRRGMGFVRFALPTVLVAGGAALLPLALPVLPVDRYVAYAARLGVAPSTDERKEVGRLPQFFADMHGWQAHADAFAALAERLSPEERARACVYGDNYGVASAVRVLGRERGLPPAISGHNQYWLWGPGACDGSVILLKSDRPDRLREIFASVEPAGTLECGDCMPYENHRTLWICREPKVAMADLWPSLKHYD